MNKAIRKNSISFIFFTIIQVIVFQNFNLSEWGFAFVYLGFILFLPIEIPVIFLLLLAFFQGIIIDTFYNTLGLHAFVLVLIAYLRSYLIRFLAPKMIDNLSNVNSIGNFGLQRVTVYILVLVFVHHLFLFYLMAAGESSFLVTLLKIIISTFISSLIIFLLRRLFFNTL